jgi:hypothetical protein
VAEQRELPGRRAAAITANSPSSHWRASSVHVENMALSHGCAIEIADI